MKKSSIMKYAFLLAYSVYDWGSLCSWQIVLTKFNHTNITVIVSGLHTHLFSPKIELYVWKSWNFQNGIFEHSNKDKNIFVQFCVQGRKIICIFLKLKYRKDQLWYKELRICCLSCDSLDLLGKHWTIKIPKFWKTKQNFAQNSSLSFPFQELTKPCNVLASCFLLWIHAVENSRRCSNRIVKSLARARI